MDIFLSFYNEVVWRPLFNGLIWIYTIAGNDFGIAIILFTLVFRVIFFPLHWKARSAQKNLAIIQPEMKRIQERFKNDREGQGRALMELYSKNKVNPFSGCLPILIQFPVLIALFQIFRNGFDPALLTYLYSFVSNPASVNPIAFGFLDLAKGNIVLGFFAAIAQFMQTKIMTPPSPPSSDKADFAQILQKQMLYVFPLLVLWWSYTLPAALTLYWTFLNIFGIVQDTIVNRIMKKKEKNVDAANQYGHTNTSK